MKKLITILSGVMLVLTLVACGSQSDKNNEQTSQSTNEDTALETEQQPSEVQSGKTLVVYYSATGNTKEVAGYIADAAEADTFELVPAEPYTSEDLDWTNEDSRVSREHDNPDERVVELVETTVSDWESYDTIYIGYPKMEYSL